MKNRISEHLNSTKTEKHCWQFRDQKIPARLFYLLRDDKITTTDLLLISVIDALVKPQGDEDGIGCYATNRYLGNAVNACPQYVSERVQYLASMHMLLIVNIGDQRYLEVEWSRTAEERKNVAGQYGKALRRAYRKMLKAAEKEAETAGTPPTGKPVPPLRENPYPPPTGKPVTEVIGKGIKELEVKHRHAATAAASVSGSEPPLCGDTNHHSKPAVKPPTPAPFNQKGRRAAKPREPVPPECIEAARLAHRASCRAHKMNVQGQPLVWATNLAAICKRIKEDGIKRVCATFRWYADHVGDPGYKGRGPDVTCSKAVNERTFMWLERLMEEGKGGSPKRQWDDIPENRHKFV